MSKFVTLVLETRFNDEYGEYANLPVFNAHGDVVGYTGGEVPETGNPCEFYVMDEEGFPVCHSASENAKLRRAFNETLIRLVAANNVAASSCMDDEYLELMRELGIEVDG